VFVGMSGCRLVAAEEGKCVERFSLTLGTGAISFSVVVFIISIGSAMISVLTLPLSPTPMGVSCLGVKIERE
jgi:hypothetical protein